jgi:hypothetical protein
MIKFLKQLENNLKTITLAKARKLDAKIGTLLNVPIKTSFKISKYSTKDILNSEYMSNFEFQNVYNQNIINLVDLKFGIRFKIQSINQSSGINELLNKKQNLISKNTIIENIIYSVESEVESSRYSIDVILAKMNKLEPESYHTSDIVEYIVIDKDQLEKMKDECSDFNNRITDIDDEILMKNISNKIDISQTDIDLLKYFKINI